MGLTSPPSPTVWVLLDDRPGNATQSLGLAEALGWPFQSKHIVFSSFAKLHTLHDRLLGATVHTVDQPRSDAVEPPWPDVVIAAGRRLVPVARWIRRQSAGRTKLVHLGRKGGQIAGHFDVVVTPQSCGFPAHPHRIQTVVPVNRVSRARLSEEAVRWGNLFESRPRPHIGLLVGGATARHVFGKEEADSLGRDVAQFAKSQGGSVFAITSRRTGVAASEALRTALGASHVVYPWRKDDADNPYWGCLAVSDVLVVTGESESMVGEAVSVGKPVYLYALEERPLGLGSRAAEWLMAPRANGVEWCHRMAEELINAGVIRPVRDLAAMHARLYERGLAAPLGETHSGTEYLSFHETQRVAEEVRMRLGLSGSS